MKQKFRQKFLPHFRTWDKFLPKKLKNRDFEGSVEKNRGSDIQIFFFIGLALLSTQTWWTTSKTFGASPERYEPIFRTLNQKILNFHEKHGSLLLILPMFFRNHKWNFFLKSMQKHRNSGVVACAGNLKFGMSLPLASFSITKKYQKFRRRARASRALSKLVKIMIFAQKWSKNTFFGSMCW